MTEFVKVEREIHPDCNLPSDLDKSVWRYMDISKFQSLLNEKALYLCRADRLQDRFEGTYSRQQILEMEDWFKKIGEPNMSEVERQNREQDRLRTYINCWCMYDYDLDLMWQGYVRNHPGVAIKSSVRKLQQICDNAVAHWPLDISRVSYFDHANGEFTNYFGTPSTFLKKDNHFQLDNELRIIHHPNVSTPSPEHIFLPVVLEDLIEEVVLQPKSTHKDLTSVREAMDKAGLKSIPVLASRDDREIIK